MKRIGLIVGTVIVALVVAAGVVSFVWTPFDPTFVDPTIRNQSPGWPHLMGTDGFGQDLGSRILAGSRIALMVGLVAVSIAAIVGIPLGIVAGMTTRRVGQVIMRAADILYAFPALLLAILLAAAIGGSTLTGMIAIGVSTIPAFVRLARAATLQVMSQDYVCAARASGTLSMSIGVRHVWPNIAPLMGVQVTVSFAMAILSEAALSYLGLATPPTTPTWGRMLYDAQKYLFTDPNQALWPGLAIAVTVLGFNLLGDSLRDYLDPRLREIR